MFCSQLVQVSSVVQRYFCCGLAFHVIKSIYYVNMDIKTSDWLKIPLPNDKKIYDDILQAYILSPGLN